MSPAVSAQQFLDRVLQPDVMAADCPSRTILAHVTGRWGTLVLVALLATEGEMRFAELRRRIGGISERMLAQTLQQLEGDGLIERHARPVVPPHVGYCLTPLGRGLAARLLDLVAWIEGNLSAMLAAGACRGDAQSVTPEPV